MQSCRLLGAALLLVFLLLGGSNVSGARVPELSSLLHLIKAPWSPVHRDCKQTPSTKLQHGWAIWNAGQWSFSSTAPPDNAPSAPAYANYSHYSNHASGFGQLRVETDPQYSNEVQMQAAGFVEGYLTAPQIFDHWYNQRYWLLSQTKDSYKVLDWLMQHFTWLTDKLNDPANSKDPFWQAMSLVVAQLQGMLEGYNAHVASSEGQELGLDFISLGEWLALNTMGDMDDLLELLFRDDAKLGLNNLHNMEPTELATRLATRGRCSVLVKVTPDLSDILVGHTTWWTYTAMTRIYKHYHFALHGQLYKAHTTSMSSYPGMVSSMDDFYILDSHLIVTETSNGVLDPRVWDVVVPQAALSWQRVLVANWLSDTGAQWAYWVKKHNSGTYNNQYIVVDMNKFSPGAELQQGLLTIVEQMPGLVMSADMTQALERNYWPSYNIPYFPEIYNRSGYPHFTALLKVKQAAAADGGLHESASAYTQVINSLSYQLAPRAKISRRDQGHVSDLDTLKAYMRSNSFRTEPFSGGSSFGAICGRGDVNPTTPKASGCNDAKVTNYKLAMSNAAEAVNGPTTGNDGSLGAFSWQGKWEHIAHRGMPKTFNFAFELQQP